MNHKSKLLKHITENTKTNSTCFDLSDFTLGQLDRIIGKMDHLEELILINNQLRELPDELSNLIKLFKLHLQYNHFFQIPDCVYSLEQLKMLDLRNNRITKISNKIGRLINLEKLYLNDNFLTDLPEEILSLDKLRILSLVNNQLPIPPEILNKFDRPNEILTYYFKHHYKPLVHSLSKKIKQKMKKKELNEAKMLIVGQSAVGKTSLINRLKFNTYNLNESMTKGINVVKWKVSYNKKGYKLNIWDFGGQEIMHATHQFFLTKRSLYILVLDSRLDDQENRIEYWLKLIQCYGGDSPIIIICNKCDEQILDVNLKGLKKKYPNIKHFLRKVSCKTGNGIDKLKKTILLEISQLDHINDELLSSWYDIKNYLENMKSDYISYQTYRELCKNNKVEDAVSQSTLISFLNDLGIILHFPEHGETNVLNPEWVTNGVYKFLTSDKLKADKGVLSQDYIDQILDINKYPTEKHIFILNIMNKFELCFKLEGYYENRYLIPELLPKEEPDIGEWDNFYCFKYEYDVLPASIISRFIVRMYKYISKGTYWRYGVILYSEETESKSLIKADLEDKTIKIFIKGNIKSIQVFLGIIRSDFYRIHSSLPNLVIKEKIPVPEDKAVEVDYNHLKNLKANGHKKWIPEGLLFEVNINDLLNGVGSLYIEEKDNKNNDNQDMIENPSSDYGNSDHKNKIFISYSHVDSVWLNRLKLHFAPLEKKGILESWDDSKIKPGMQWRSQIKRALNAARVAVLLITADFLASEFISENELPPLLINAKKKGTLIYPVIIKPCGISYSKLEMFQAVNPPSKPLMSMTECEQEEFFVKLVTTINQELHK